MDANDAKKRLHDDAASDTLPAFVFGVMDLDGDGSVTVAEIADFGKGASPRDPALSDLDLSTARFFVRLAGEAWDWGAGDEDLSSMAIHFTGLE